MAYINCINKWWFAFFKVLFYFILFDGGFPSTCSVLLFSRLLLCKIIDITCCIAIVLISLKVCLMVFLRYFELFF